MSIPKKSETREETKLLLDLADTFHDRGLYLPTRTIYVGSETVDDSGDSGVDGRLAERVLKNLHLLECVSNAPITLLMNNGGGDEYHGLAIIDAIAESPCEVRCIVRGVAMSMGSWILQACDWRVMGPHSTQMIHVGSWGYVGHARTAKKWAEEAERTTALMERTYLRRIREKHPKYAIEDLRQMLDHDTFLDAHASIAMGLADAVG
ncbi:MAG: ATP-dependent Clp protease proteolytic subunit [Polyangia bacterium]